MSVKIITFILFIILFAILYYLQMKKRFIECHGLISMLIITVAVSVCAIVGILFYIFLFCWIGIGICLIYDRKDLTFYGLPAWGIMILTITIAIILNNYI